MANTPRLSYLIAHNSKWAFRREPLTLSEVEAASRRLIPATKQEYKMSVDPTWYNEASETTGTGFSLKVTQKLHEEQSPYQKITVYETQSFGKLLTLDGLVMVTDRDNFVYHEMMSHPVLFSHPAPRRVVIIGGGDCGTLREVLKHQHVAQAWQVEIDERVTRVCETYFPKLCESNHDPRARFYFGDGIKWIHEAEPGSLDAIIIDSTDPVGPAAGLFAIDFYRGCLRALAPNGVVVQQSESPLLHLPLIERVRHDLIGAGFSSVATLTYPQVSYPSGWWSSTMAGKGVDVRKFRERDAEARTFATEYYTAALHRGALALPAFMERAFSKECQSG